MTPVLEVRALRKVHGDGDAEVVALRDVEMVLGHGEFLAVTGPSGCGKSTLLNLLGGLDRPTAGEIHLHGERVDDAGEARRARLRRSELGFVFQFFNLIDNLTVADNVELPALLAGVPAREARRRASATTGSTTLASPGCGATASASSSSSSTCCPRSPPRRTSCYRG